MKWTVSRVAAFALVVVSVIAAIVMVWVSAARQLSPLENTLFAILSLGAGLAGSYLIGQQSAQETARELMKPAARSAFRRVLWLYASLLRLGRVLEAADGNRERVVDVASALVREQLASAADSLNDWRDLVPDELADIEHRLRVSESAPTDHGDTR